MIKPPVDTVLNSPIDTWPIRHSSMPNNKTLDFYGCDTEELFLENQKKLSGSWIYSENPVTYNFNSHGLRMKKDIQEISKDYIYFGGSSYTLGVGINEEDRFSEKTSKQLGLDFVNFSGPIYGIKLQTVAFFNFLKTNIHLPKILVVEHLPDAYNYYSAGNHLLYKSKYFADAEQYPHHYDAITSLSNTDYFLQESVMYSNFLYSTCKRLNIKLVEISFFKDDEYVKEYNIPVIDRESNKQDLNYCYGRDLFLSHGSYTGHAGIGINQEMTDLLLTLI